MELTTSVHLDQDATCSIAHIKPLVTEDRLVFGKQIGISSLGQFSIL